MSTIQFTKSGFEKLKKDFEDLEKSRPAAVLDLKKAREMGDLSENGYYKAAKFKLSSIDHQLSVLKHQIKSAVIIENKNNQTINIGSLVTLEGSGEKITYQIVGDLEANPSENKISSHSPIGKAIFNKKAGDEVEINLPKGIVKYKVVKIN